MPITSMPSGVTSPTMRQIFVVPMSSPTMISVFFCAISGQLHGRPTGPESSLVKLVWSDVSNRVAETRTEVTGEVDVRRLSVRQVSIAGGTTQVNKNIVAQRILGLPRG